MKTRNMLRAVALAGTCLVPMAAYADDFMVQQSDADKAAAAPAAPLMTPGGLPFDGWVGLGLMGVSNGNTNYSGRYTGLNTSGVDVGITDMNLRARSAWDSGQGLYYELNGWNLILQPGDRPGIGNGDSAGNASTEPLNHSINNNVVNSGTLELKLGDAGVWAAGVRYNSITYTGNVIDSIYSMSGNQGTLNAPLLAFGGSNGTKAGPYTSAGIGVNGAAVAGGYSLAQLNAADQPVLVGTRRDQIGADFKYFWNNWTIAGGFTYEHKEGSVEESFDSAWGGQVFADPVNFDTTRYDLSASYFTRNFQTILQYTWSHFVDNNVDVSLPKAISGTGLANSPFQQTSAYSTPPSNDAHYLTALIADNGLIPKTRLNLNLRVGIEAQNNELPPNTLDTTIPAGSTLTGLNSTLGQAAMQAPDLVATIIQAKLSATSNPWEGVNTRIFYGFDERSVNHYALTSYVGATGGLASDTTPGGSLMTSVPQDWTKENMGAEAGYMIDQATTTKVSASARLDLLDRSNAVVGHSNTETGSLAFSSQYIPDVDARISFDLSNRSGTVAYEQPWGILGQNTLQYSIPYFQAPMTSEGVTIHADWAPTGSPFSGGFFVQFKNENYHYPSDLENVTAQGITTASPVFNETGVLQGVQQDYALVLGPDFNYRPSKSLNFHAFYTFERIFFNITGNGACSTGPATTAGDFGSAACAGAAGYFRNTDTADTHTVGVALDWQLNDKLKLRGEYTVSYGDVMFSEFNGVFVSNPTQPYQNLSNYPDINTLMHSVKLTATYQLMPNVELIGQGVWMYMNNNDWQDQANGVQTSTAINVTSGATTQAVLMTPGYAAPNYNILAALVGVRVKF